MSLSTACITNKPRLAMVWILGAALLINGCRTASDYRATDLPLELRAARVAPPSAIDLSNIARHSINADLIYPGDVIQVTVATGLEEIEPQSWPIRVTDEGDANIPLVGPVRVAGLTLTDAESEIYRQSVDREIYRDPHVAVLMQQRRSIKVRVVGAVETPGVYDLPAAGSDLLAAIVAAGGLTDKAGTIVELRHPNSSQAYLNGPPKEGVMLASFVESPDVPRRTTRVDLTDRSPETQQADLHVEDGTVVMVYEKARRSISVIGLVRQPDSYELPMDEPVRVLDALAMAGGVTVSMADDVRVIRQSPDEQTSSNDESDPTVIRVSIRQAKQNGDENLVLMPGDVVSVEETPSTFVVETIRSFIRFGFSSAIPGF